MTITADLLEALQWYEERTRLLSDKTKSTSYIEAISTELILDAGRRARTAIEVLTRHTRPIPDDQEPHQ